MAEIKTQNRAMQMLRNLGIYAVGSIGSRLMTFLLVPIYSFFISPSEFGYYDICFAAILLMTPIISFQLREGAFRFLLDTKNDDERAQIVSFAILTMLRNVIAFISIGIVVYFVFNIWYLWYTLLFAIVFTLFELVQQLLRGLGHNKLFAGCGILSSFLIFAVSVPLVVWTEMGIEGVFVGNIAARIIAMLFAEWRVGVFSKFMRSNVDYKAVGREVIRFSSPLLVVNMILIIISSGNRFFIEHYLGLHDNGLYAVAVKFASILEAIAFIFIQAWQETAIRQYGDADHDAFYSKILNAYLWVLVALVVSISYVTRLLNNYFIGVEYQDSICLILPQCLASAILNLVFFYDMGYQCSKNTSRQLPCLITALLVSLTSNYYFTIWWGLYGILASINVTYLFMLVYKMIDTRRYMKLRIEPRSVAMLGLLLLSGAMYYVIHNNILVAVYFALVLMAMAVCCPASVKQMLADKLRRNKA